MLERFAKVISESLEQAGPLRLTEARSGARVCDPQQFTLIALTFILRTRLNQSEPAPGPEQAACLA